MSDFSDAASRVRKLRDTLEEEHRKETKGAMDTMRVEVHDTIKRNDSVARHALLSDVRNDEKESGRFFIEQSVNVPEWAKYLEHGTGLKGRYDTLPDHETYKAPDPLPPLDPILTWVIAKNLTSENYDSKTALAEAIAQTIGEEGNLPHPFLRPVWYGTYGYRRVIKNNKRAMKMALRKF